MPVRPRRSCLAVPGNQTRFHAKADQSSADEVFFDLEDAVAPSEKVKARALIIDALRTLPLVGKTRVVRANSCDTEWCYDDIITILEGAGDHLDCLMIPKVEGADHVDTLVTQLETKLRLRQRIGLELQIESARGLENVGAIASASIRSETLIFGPADFEASLQTPERPLVDSSQSIRATIGTSFSRGSSSRRARTACRRSTAPAPIRDLDGLRTFARRAAMLGYDGKWALHPGQIEILNETFAPRQEDFDKATAIIEAYRHVTDVQHAGAVMLGDEMIDEASRKMAVAMIERGRVFGMEARPWSPRSTT